MILAYIYTMNDMTQAEIAALEALEAQDEQNADLAMMGAVDDADWL